MPSEKEKDKDKEKSTRAKLSLKGSAKLVSEFFEFSINSILFQRGVYPPEDFAPVKKYGLNMLVTSDDQVKAYIKKIMSQLNKWMTASKISRLVVVITSKETGENIERWKFDVDISGRGTAAKKSKSGKATAAAAAQPGDEENSAAAATDASADSAAGVPPAEEKTEAQIQAEIQAIFRQITASVTFLPTLDEPCTFNVLVYADADSEVPLEWGDSDAREIAGGEKVQLRGFSTGEHRVGTSVSYRLAGE